MEKTGSSDCKCGKRGTCVVMDLAALTRQTRLGPLSHVPIYVGPKIPVCDQTLSGLSLCMRKVVKGIKDGF